jgi:ketol-acid reductoisomerase
MGLAYAAAIGKMTRGPLVINDETKRRLKGLLAEIQSGAFANDWMKESRNDALAGRE